MSASRLQQIRTAALEVVYRKGYDAASLREIAQEVGIQTPSLYNYISSKQELLVQLMESVMEDLLKETRAALEGVVEPVERLKVAISTFVLFNIHHPHEAAVSDAGFKSLSAENRERVVMLRDEFEAIYSEALSEGIEQGAFEVGDVRIVRNAILSACARIYFWHDPSGRRKPHQVAEEITTYLVAGLRPNRDSAKAEARAGNLLLEEETS